jgi:uncharacterized protein
MSAQIVIDYDVPVPMPDGIVLAADVIRPSRPGRYPVILVRTPYGKLWTPPDLATCIDPLHAAREGFVTVIQDVRGTGSSEGDFRPYLDMAADGEASIAWAASQEWSTGNVGMVGFSHLASAALLAATQAPQALRCVAVGLAASEFYDGCRYQGGALQLHNALPWAAAMSLVDLQRRARLGEDVGSLDDLAAIVSDFPQAMQRVPQLSMAEETPGLGTYLEWLSHPERDEFWRETAVTERYATVNCPALHIIGWYDNFLKGTLENYAGLKTNAASAHARDHQYLVVGPWGHGSLRESVGEIWFGAQGDPGAADLAGAHMEFFKSFLAGNPAPDRAPVKLFVMAANVWRDEDAWPLARAIETRLYLRADRTLSLDPPADEAPDHFRYDPHDPVPTLGGSSQRGDYGPRDRRSIEVRPDVLTYTTDVLADDLEVTGFLRAHLYVATSARDTDFTAALVDVYPDGRALGIAEGILRLRYRNGLDRQLLATPGETYEVDVDLVATSNVFRAGHRVRVEISSSDFPRWDRNPNDGGVVAAARETDFLVAEQHVFHDSARASYIALPVIPV